jgi:hypothetical protein
MSMTWCVCAFFLDFKLKERIMTNNNLSVDGELQKFLDTGAGTCPLGADDLQLGYACGHEPECVAARRMGCCPYELAAETRRQVWADADRRTKERAEQDPWGLGLPSDEDLHPEDNPWETG